MCDLNCVMCVCVLVVERLLLMLSVRTKGSAVRIAIICGTETCGWLRTERDIEWRNVIGHRTLSGKTCLRLVNVFAETGNFCQILLYIQ